MKEIKIPVVEFFGPTIQGEGPNVGVKTLFLRVAGCDFKCDFCDSKFTWKVDKNTLYYTKDELIEIIKNKCKTTNTSHLVLTGGNPCLYDFNYIISELRENNIAVDIETQGSILPEWLKLCNLIVISPKAPSSNMKDVYENIRNWLEDNEYLPPIAIKIPIFNLVDFEFSLKYNKLISSYSNKHDIKFYLSVGNSNVEESGDISVRILSNYEWLINEVIKNKLDNVYILPQMHTLIWGNRQGV